jgi:hypothetical protein
MGGQTVCPHMLALSGRTVWCTDGSSTIVWPKWLNNLVDKLFGHTITITKTPHFGGQTV